MMSESFTPSVEDNKVSSVKPVGYLTNLTALRGFAALMVVMFHVKEGIIHGLHLPIPLDIPLLNKGYLAVDFFFVLSGFVLMHVYGNKLQEVTKANYASFIKNRLARIYPVHVFLMFVLLAFKIGGVYHTWLPYLHFLDSKDILSNGWTFITTLLMIQSWHIHSTWTWNVPAWSISSEWFVYLFAPFLIVFFAPKNDAKQSLSVWLGGCFLITALHLAFPDSFFAFDFGNLRMLFEFIIGVGLYHIYQVTLSQCEQNVPEQNLSTLLLQNKKISFDRLFVLFSLLTVFSITLAEWQPELMPDYLLIIQVAFIIPLAALSTQYVARFLSLKPLVYLGEISYSLYLVHTLLNGLLREPFHFMFTPLTVSNYLIFQLICIMVSLVASHFLYQYIEIPARNWLRKMPFIKQNSNISEVSLSIS